MEASDKPTALLAMPPSGLIWQLSNLVWPLSAFIRPLRQPFFGYFLPERVTAT